MPSIVTNPQLPQPSLQRTPIVEKSRTRSLTESVMFLRGSESCACFIEAVHRVSTLGGKKEMILFQARGRATLYGHFRAVQAYAPTFGQGTDQSDGAQQRN